MEVVAVCSPFVHYLYSFVVIVKLRIDWEEQPRRFPFFFPERGRDMPEAAAAILRTSCCSLAVVVAVVDGDSFHSHSTCCCTTVAVIAVNQVLSSKAPKCYR